jgi:hypothetical protein
MSTEKTIGLRIEALLLQLSLTITVNAPSRLLAEYTKYEVLRQYSNCKLVA